MYCRSHSILLLCFPHYLCDLHATEFFVSVGAGSIFCHSQSIAIYSQWTKAVCPEAFVHSSSFRSQFNQSADRKLSRGHATHVAWVFWAQNSHHVRFWLVCTRELVNFEFSARFVQIMRVCDPVSSVLCSVNLREKRDRMWLEMVFRLISLTWVLGHCHHQLNWLQEVRSRK